MNREERIEAYLMRTLTDIDRQHFEQEMARDPELQEEVAEMRILLLGIETSALKKKLITLTEEGEQSKIVSFDARQSNRRSLGWWAKAASVLLLMGLGTWFLLQNRTDSPDLYAQFYYADPGLQTPMSAVDQYAFYDAMVDYKAEKYTQAIEKWNALMNDAPDNDTLQYYLASAHLNQGDQDAALMHFQPVIDQPNSVFNQKAKWYWSLIQLKRENWPLLRAKWQEWNMLEEGAQIYPLESFWESLPAQENSE